MSSVKSVVSEGRGKCVEGRDEMVEGTVVTVMRWRQDLVCNWIGLTKFSIVHLPYSYKALLTISCYLLQAQRAGLFKVHVFRGRQLRRCTSNGTNSGWEVAVEADDEL
ncbi:hypothetical protein BC937DRAFT_89956 [Endogone sp. FLAS-F59071]|nr:hypothetical protein BC937DRAFT_89956 [Endogone sp. FLAS-F59071]|eukprot:RUS22229.1 hypothetical protein BC937DRAFT_89956 [Endogone sp. FLAS-F59071]